MDKDFKEQVEPLLGECHCGEDKGVCVDCMQEDIEKLCAELAALKAELAKVKAENERLMADCKAWEDEAFELLPEGFDYPKYIAALLKKLNELRTRIDGAKMAWIGDFDGKEKRLFDNDDFRDWLDKHARLTLGVSGEKFVKDYRNGKFHDKGVAHDLAAVVPFTV